MSIAALLFPQKRTPVVKKTNETGSIKQTAVATPRPVIKDITREQWFWDKAVLS